MSRYKGKKRAQRLHRYMQMHGEKDEWGEPGKQKQTDCINFQTDGSGVEDKNKYCNVCEMFFTSPVVALSHYLGKVHRRKLKQFSGDQARMAAQSVQPLSALQMPLAEKPLLPSEAAESSSSADTKLNLNDPEKYCKLCCAPFNNPVVAWEHYAGKRHRKSEARQKVLKKLGDEAVPAEFITTAVGAGYYVCSVCNIILTSVQMYHSHMMGIKHQINLRKQATEQKTEKNTEQKRRIYSEGEDFGKENMAQKKIKVEIDLVNEKKSSPYKGESLKENLPVNKSKKRKNYNKKLQTVCKKEEDLLWEESVLRY